MRRTLRIEPVTWLETEAELSEVVSDEPTPDELTKAAFVFAFARDRLLMVRTGEEQWELPGGLRKPDEPPARTAERHAEAMARVVLGRPRRFAWQRIRLLGAPPAEWEHGPDSYMALFLTWIVEEQPLVGKKVQRKLFPPLEARSLPWIQENHLLYEAALQEAAADQKK